jgi:hypothetical protein
MRARLLTIFLILFITTLVTTGSKAAQVEQLIAPTAPQADLGVDFTYQGYLELNGKPVNGTCDFRFLLWDAQTGGEQLGATQEILGEPVNQGRFTVMLTSRGNNPLGEDDSVFYGKALWLEIGVVCPDGSGDFTILSPRQALTVAPYAASLRPGADVVGSVDNTILSLVNNYVPPDYLHFSFGLYASGNSAGVFGFSNSVGGVGVQGTNTNGTGVQGNGDPGVAGYGGQYGVYGWGPATGSSGVFGESGWGTGVSGGSETGTGGYFQSSAPCCNGAALKAWNTTNGIGVWASTGSNAALYGQGRSSGVVGEATANGGIGVLGRLGPGVTSGLAGQFLGDVDVTGNITALATGFQIDHPLDPANQFLNQAYVAAPEMTSQYSGNVVTGTDGFAVVTLPEYVQALNSDFRYNLTVIGQFAQAIISSKIKDGQFTIQTDQPNVEVSWLVIGVRQDPYALSTPLQVEVTKAEGGKGLYLYPQGYGLSADSSLETLYNLAAQASGSPAMELESPPKSPETSLPFQLTPSGESH